MKYALNVLLVALLCCMIGACETVNCPLENKVESVYGFYASERTSAGEFQPGSAVALADTLTVTALGADSVLVNRVTNKNGLALPMSFYGDIDSILLTVKDTTGAIARDTLWIDKTNEYHWDDPSCPVHIFHEITSVRHTRNIIDTVIVATPFVNYEERENFQIFFRTAPQTSSAAPKRRTSQGGAGPSGGGAPQEGVEEKVPWYRLVHMAVGVDLVGVGMKVVGCDWSQMEAMVRVSFKDKYFPIFELGIGEGNHEGRDLDNTFSVRAPYFRIGADYNFTKKNNGNHLFAGLRYGFSAYKYDLDSGTPITDPVWGDSAPFSMHGQKGSTHWAEAVFGVETRIWKIVRMGWDIRFKLRIKQNSASVGPPWYIPGFGKMQEGLSWGGTFKVIFDI